MFVDDESPFTRRRLLKLAAGITAGGLLASCGSVQPLDASTGAGDGAVHDPPAGIDVGPLSDWKPTTIKAFPEQKCVVLADEAGIWAMSLVCTHAGGILAWDEAKTALVCPLHGAMFDQQGTLKQAPARRNLDWYRVTVADGRVLVDPAAPVPQGTRAKRS